MNDGNPFQLLNPPTVSNLLRELRGSFCWSDGYRLVVSGYFLVGMLGGLFVGGLVLTIHSATTGPTMDPIVIGLIFGLIPISTGIVVGLWGLVLSYRYERLQGELYRDFLTGLYNHRCFRTILSQRLVEARRYGQSVTLCMLDIDQFKTINDTHGHPVGDRVLKTLAELLRSSVRAPDDVFRYGGDEFVIIYPQTSLPDAQRPAQRLRSTVQEHVFEHGVTVTLSGGLAQYPVDAHSATDLIESADQRLREAKQRGSNQVVGQLRASNIEDSHPDC